MQQPPQIPDNPYAAPQAMVNDPMMLGELQLASLGMRLAGAIIDLIIMLILIVPLMFVTGFFAMLTSGVEPGFGWTLGMNLGGFIAFLLVHGYFLNQSGQTVGKKLLGMRIVDLNGNKPEFFKLVGLRYGVTQLIGLIPLVGTLYGLVNVLFIFRSDRRCIHDLIAGTRVVVA